MKIDIKTARREIENRAWLDGKTKGKVTGEYNEDGYEIFFNGSSVYSAGNCRWDSQSHSEREHALPLATIRDYCQNTAKEIAEEQHAEFFGITMKEQ